MLRLSKLADYAAAILVRLGRHGELVAAGVLAAETGMPEPTVAKLLKILAGAGLVVSLRGARGGYRIARPLEDISVAALIEAIDGPIAVVACCDGALCARGLTCGMYGRWDVVNNTIRQSLSRITLADMATGEPANPPQLATPPTPGESLS
ncbi:SUF system Fe-S cluster assembly regulator [Formicincola oecophyllae]|uniref:SUF system Fe-S cluster assembly regulator n=1 Tax=Formicincola oecophyllae TaxID=2558361 RepID=A0A4Y6U9Z2_9PROT|nr:SUF system Fe-S cluster assembly regulator [Formicincola oecophyllae]QDH12975.1 SUF system Fe-S cluster assembly regulator [Formicincola oecophyllae]